MKRTALIKEIRKASKAADVEFEIERQGKEHELWRCGAVRVPIPRHSEIGPKMAFEIRRQCEPELGKDWWR
jgi:hypothetical protein